MKKRTADKFWFPWWPDKWIFGSIRIECTPAERGIWVDLLSLASKDDGHIRANEETPYPLDQLAGMLRIPQDEFKRAVNKFIKKGKLTRTKTGTLHVTKWDKYQFSDRHKRRLEGEMSAKSDTMAEHEDAIIKDNKIKDSKIYNNTYSLILNVKSIGKAKAKKLTDFIFEKLAKEFPDVDVLESVKKKCAWWLDHPINKKSNLHSQMRNWFRIGQGWIDEAKAQDRIGQARPQELKTPEMIKCAKVIKAAEMKVLKENPGKRGREIETLVMAARAKASQEYWRKKGK
jgi:predicted transcriptional regulator